MFNSWSFGVLLYEIITMGGAPYPGMKRLQLCSFLKSNGTMSQPDECPTSLYKIMRQCWQFAQSDRPNFVQIKEMLGKALFEKQQVYTSILPLFLQIKFPPNLDAYY